MDEKQLEALSNILPGGMSEEGKKEWAELQAKKAAAAGATNTQTQQTNTQTAQTQVQTNQTATPGVVKLTFKKTETDSSNPLLSAIGTKEEVFEVKSLEDLTKFSTEKFGFKSLGDVFDFISNAQPKVAAVDELQTKVGQFETALSVLPEEVFALNQLVWNGGDWKAMLKTMQTRDFSKKSNEIPAAELVSIYFPGKITPEDVEGKTPAFEALYEASKVKYDVEKTQYDQNINKAVDISAEKTKAKKESLKAAENHLKQSEIFKHIPDDKIREVENGLMQNFINDEFFMPDGSFKPDSLEKALILKFGKDALTSALNKVAGDAKAEGAAEILRAASEKEKNNPTGNSGAGGTVDQKRVQDVIEKFGLNRLNPSNQFEHVSKADKK